MSFLSVNKDVPLPVAIVDESATESSLVETLVCEVTPPIKAAVIEHVATAEPVSIETPQGEAKEFDISTSASAGKNPKFLDLACVLLYLLLNLTFFCRGFYGSCFSNDIRT